MTRPSWRCRHGFHRFVFVSMSNVRDVAAWSEGGSFHVCNLVERCERCGLRRTNDYAHVPRRVRVGVVSTDDEKGGSGGEG